MRFSLWAVIEGYNTACWRHRNTTQLHFTITLNNNDNNNLHGNALSAINLQIKLTKWADIPSKINQRVTDNKATYIRLKRSVIFLETEESIFTVQAKVIPSGNYLKYIIKDTKVMRVASRFGGSSSETILLSHVQNQPKMLTNTNTEVPNFPSGIGETTTFLGNRIFHITNVRRGSSWKTTATNST